MYFFITCVTVEVGIDLKRPFPLLIGPHDEPVGGGGVGVAPPRGGNASAYVDTSPFSISDIKR